MSTYVAQRFTDCTPRMVQANPAGGQSSASQTTAEPSQPTGAHSQSAPPDQQPGMLAEKGRQCPHSHAVAQFNDVGDITDKRQKIINAYRCWIETAPTLSEYGQQHLMEYSINGHNGGHACTKECDFWWHHYDVYICIQSGNFHVCNTTDCELAEASPENDNEVCPFTGNVFPLRINYDAEDWQNVDQTSGKAKENTHDSMSIVAPKQRKRTAAVIVPVVNRDQEMRGIEHDVYRVLGTGDWTDICKIVHQYWMNITSTKLFNEHMYTTYAPGQKHQHSPLNHVLVMLFYMSSDTGYPPARIQSFASRIAHCRSNIASFITSTKLNKMKSLFISMIAEYFAK
jgi:hypothetical protein